MASELEPGATFRRSTTVWITVAVLAFVLSAAASLFHQGPGHRSLILLPTLLITTAIYRLSATHSFARIFPLLVLVYVAVTLDYLHGPFSPRGDSYVFHIPSFLQIAEGFARGEGFSEWLPAAGGVRTGFSHIHLGVATPHRFLGYLLYSITPLSALVAYKSAFAIGIILIGLGWGLCLERLTRSTLGASLGSLAIMLGGTGTGFHQEQILYTMMYMPWLLLALIEIKRDRRWLVVFAALLGLAATAHFPQIYALSLTLVVLMTLLASPRSIKDRVFLPGRNQLIASVLLFGAAALPLVYILANMDGLLSWHRPNLTAISYTNYIEMLGRQYRLSDMLQYVRPSTDLPLENLDISGFYTGEVTVIFALAAIVFAFRAAWPIALFALIAAMLTVGTGAPIDIVGVLYLVASPIIKSFREWYHFFPVVNFCLAALAAIGITWCAQRVETMRHRGYGKLPYALAGIFVLGIYQLAYVVFPYSRGHYLIEHENRITREDFSRYDHDPSVLQYRARLILDREEAASIDRDASPQAMDNPRPVFVAASVKYGIGLPDDQISAYLASGPAGNIAIIGGAPTDHPEIVTGKPSAAATSEFTLRTHGIDIATTSAKSSLLVTPMNYDLDIDATLNGKPAAVLRVNGALAGIPVPAGKSSVSLRVKPDIYPWIFYLHALVQLIAAGMIIYLLAGTRMASQSPFAVQPPSTNRS